MSTDDDLLQMPRPRRRVVPPNDPSEDELARDWDLTAADLTEINRCRGADHRRRFALQLCMLRTYGRFLDDYRQASLRIVNHLSRQIGVPAVLFLDRPGRGATERGQAKPVPDYLGLGIFDESAEPRLRDWLCEGVFDGRSMTELLARGGGGGGGWGVVLPAP